MKKLLLLILPILLCVFGVNINVKAAGDNWYTPDLEEYTFNISRNSTDFIFKRHDFDTGNFVNFLNRGNDFGVSQNANGELDFNSFQQTLLWVAQRSIEISTGGGGGGGGGISRYGLIPLITDSLPSYITYNIYNTLDRSLYKGAVDRHVITYRLDFFGNYSMLLNDYIYDIVYSIEITFELIIYYFDEIDSFFLERGYTIHWYDTSEMEDYKLYTPMDNVLLHFLLRSLDYMEDYQQGYNAGFEEGYDTGYDEGYDLGHEAGYNEGHEVGYDVGYNEGHDDGYSEGYDVGYDVGYDIGIEVAQPKMDILLITLIMFILSVFVYFKFRLRWVLIATTLLWFVPIFLVENLFIKIFSVIMIIATIVITFYNDREEDDLE